MEKAASNKRKKKKRKASTGHRRIMPVAVVITAVLVLVLLGAGAFFVNANYVFYQGHLLERDTEVLMVPEGELPTDAVLQRLSGLALLDLRGRQDVTPEDAERLMAALPVGCHLAWNVPLTDGYFSSDATELVLPGCTEEDIARLRYFEGLMRVDATGAVCYEALAALNDTVEVTYTFPLGDGVLTNHDTTFTATGVGSMAGLDAVLPFFPQLKEADLRNGTVPNEEMRAFIKAHPELTIHWTVHYGDAAFDAEAETIDLTGITFADAGEASTFLSCFTALTELDLRGTGLFNDDAVTAAAAAGEIPFRYDVRLYGNVYATDTAELDLAQMERNAVNTEELQAVLPHLKELRLVRFPEGMEAGSTEALAEAWPDVLFIRPVTVFGQTLSNDVKELDISGKTVTLDEVKDACTRLPFLERLVMCGCGLTNEQMDVLLAAFPAVRFVWEVRLGPHTLRTDAVAFSTKNPSKHTNPNASDKYNKLVKSTVRLNEGDIAALKYCTDLVALDLGHNYLTNKDLQVIGGLTHLKILILADNKITDISALKGLAELEYIELFMNKIPDMSPLSGLTALTDVNVCNTGMTSLKPFEKLPNLQRFWFAMNGISRAKCKELADHLSGEYGTVCNYTVTDETSGGWREGERYAWLRSYLYE